MAEIVEGQLEQLEVQVELYDGRSWLVTVENPDMVRYEDNADRLKLGTPKTQPNKWLNYVTWSALTRTHELDAMPFEAFKREARIVHPFKKEPVDPTQPAPGDG
jgi:hypothetical protein